MWKPERKVHFEEKVAEPTQEEFYTHLEKYSRQSLWIYLVFFLSCWVGFCVQMNRTKEDFVTSREISCLTADVLTRNNWTYFQVRNISYGDSRYNCEQVDALDTLLTYSFERALNEFASGKRPTYVRCPPKQDVKYYNRTYEFLGTCKSYLFKQRLRVLNILGEMMGPLPLGCVADLYGRKVSIMICLVLWTVNIILTGLIGNFHLSHMFAIFDGAATMGMIVFSLMLFLELCDRRERGLMCLYLDIFQMVGWTIGVYVRENCKHHTRDPIFLLAFPIVMLYFYIWYVPESPRWCISCGKKKKAWNILRKLGVNIDGVFFLPSVKFNKRKVLLDNALYLTSYIKYKKAVGLGSFLYFISMAVYESEAKFVTMKYLTISTHTGMLFLAKLVSHLYMIPLFLMLSRHMAIFFSIVLSIVILFTSLFAHGEYDYLLNILNVACTYKLRSLVLLYICEIIPTCSRGSFIGVVMLISKVFYLFHFIYQEILLGTIIENEHAASLVYQGLGVAVLFTLNYKGSEELHDNKIYRE